jgi:membrane-bound serine protease (ClpP class)
LAPGARPAAAQALPQARDNASGHVVVIELDREIDKVTARFIARHIHLAEKQGAGLIIIRLDTPGGTLESTRTIVREVFASSVPVAVYVAPEGAQAASAGTFIAAAATVVAMAPATNIGAAAVVGIQGEDLPETLGKKSTEDAAAFLRSIAERRGRPIEPLDATVRNAAAYSAEEAVKNGLADLIAKDTGDLLRQLDGSVAQVSSGEVTLSLTGVELRTAQLNLFERFLGFLANPTLAFLLMSLGGLGIVVELWSPGLIVPGVLGVIFLVLGFAGLGQLPFSWAGVALFVLAIALLIAEALHPGFGFFGVTGIIALILSGVFIIGGSGTPDFPDTALRVSRWLIVALGVSALAILALLIREVRLSRKAGPYVNPYSRENLVGQSGEVVLALDPQGQVRAAGEIWSAEAAGGSRIEIGRRVKVTATRDIWLIVEPLAPEKAEAKT